MMNLLQDNNSMIRKSFSAMLKELKSGNKLGSKSNYINMTSSFMITGSCYEALRLANKITEKVCIVQ